MPPSKKNIPQKTGESRVMNVSLAEYTPVPAIEIIDRKGWVQYGSDNFFPEYLIDLSMTSPIHGVLCKAIVRMIAGKGLISSDANTQRRIDELGLSAVQKKSAKDLKVQGGYYLEIIYDTTYKRIAKVVALPFVNCRVSAIEDTGEVNGVWYSKDWHNTRKERNKPRYLPLFNPALASKDQPAQVLIRFGEVEGSDIYPKPDYWPGITYIIMSKDIPIYHLNNLSNGLFPSFMVSFMNGIPDEETQRQIMREWEKNVSGPRNAGKFMLSFNESETTAPKVEQFPITDADKQYQYLLESSTLHVFTVHSVTTPRLFGVMAPNGFSSTAEEMIEGLKIFKNEVIEPAQRFLAEGFETILKAEGLTGVIETIQNTTVEAATGVTSTPEPPQQLSLEKKKVAPAELDTIADELIGLGTDPDEDWIEIDSFVEEDSVELAVSAGTAKPNAESEQDRRIDGKLFIARYRYSGNLSDNSRAFCRKVVNAGKYYRKEDIMAMGKLPVNPGWGPRGANTYSIWQYKGGGDCHHKWETVVFVSAKGLGVDVNSPKAKQLAVSKAKEMGYSVRNNYKVAVPPVDLPHRGFLPKD